MYTTGWRPDRAVSRDMMNVDCGDEMVRCYDVGEWRVVDDDSVPDFSFTSAKVQGRMHVCTDCYCMYMVIALHCAELLILNSGEFGYYSD